MLTVDQSAGGWASRTAMISAELTVSRRPAAVSAAQNTHASLHRSVKCRLIVRGS
jgi:hypothetical protein